MTSTLIRIKDLLSPRRKVTEDPRLLIPPKIIRNKVVADMGCGAGYYSRYLIGYASKLYAIDDNEEMLNKAKEVAKGGNVEFVDADISKVPLRSGSIDVVLLANVFHDVKSESSVEEVRRILNDKGIVIIIDWKKKIMEIGPPYEIRMDIDDYREYFKGFRTVKEFEAGAYHYGMIMKKA